MSSYSLRRRVAARYFFLTWMKHPSVDTGIELTKKILAATRRRGGTANRIEEFGWMPAYAGTTWAGEASLSFSPDSTAPARGRRS